jgi:hypothetical protein
VTSACCKANRRSQQTLCVFLKAARYIRAALTRYFDYRKMVQKGGNSMEYAYLIRGLTKALVASQPNRIEVISNADASLEVHGVQLMRTQYPVDKNLRLYPRDYLYVGMTSELPEDPARAPHDCLCIYDTPLPKAYTQAPLNCNLIVLHNREAPEALLKTLNHAMFMLSDDVRYYRGLEQIIAAEHSGIDLAEALQLVESLMSNPAMLVGEHGHILEIGPTGFSGNQFKKEIRRGGILSPETLHQLRQESVYEPLHDQYIEMDSYAWGPDRYICLPIRIRGLRVAELIIQNLRTAFHPSKIRLMEPVATLLSSIIERQMEGSNDRTLLHNLLFAELLRAQPEQEPELRMRIAEFHWRQIPGMVLLCIHDNGQKAAFERLRAAHPGSRWTITGQQWLLLLYPEEGQRAALEEELSQEGLQGGLSWPFDDLMQIRYAYIQAKAALDQGSGTLTDYASVFVGHIFTLPAEEARHHLHPAVGKLSQDSALLTTLEMFLSGSEQAAEIAAQLFVSRSTVFYRINRIRELCGIDLTTGEERMNLLVSLRLQKLLNNGDRNKAIL